MGSRACQGLGQMAFREWREEDAVKLLRHALKLRGGELLEQSRPSRTFETDDEERDSIHDLNLLETFTHALLRTNALGEVAPLVQRYREAATAESRRRGLNGQPSTLDPQPSTLNPQPSTLNPQPSTLNPQPSTLNPQAQVPCATMSF